MRVLLLFVLVARLLAVEMIAPIVMDISDLDISEYYVSEKLDGVRGFWDGSRLLSKRSNQYHPPASFTAGFPPFAIDGELYCDEDFEDIVSDVKSGRFECVKLYVFEVPEQSGDLLQRLGALKKYLKKHPNENIQIIKQLSFESKAEFWRYFDEIVARGGEGVVLHKKDTPYHTKKSADIIKVKNYYDDECTITKAVISSGLLRSYECEWSVKNAKKAIKSKAQKELYERKKDEAFTIKIGSGFDNLHRQNPLPIGTQITIKYYKLSKNLKPMHAVFLRVRKAD